MKKSFIDYELYIIDLDDTIISEFDYLKSGYSDIADHIHERYGYPQEKIFNFIIETFKKFGRNKLFDKVIAKFNLNENEIDLMLKILRSTKPKELINLSVKGNRILDYLHKNKKRHILLTNGNVAQQKNKIKHIRWLHNTPEVIFANEIEAKPSIKSYLHYCKLNNTFIEPQNTLMIGDSIVDRIFSQNLKCDFLYINDEDNLFLPNS